MTTFTVAVSSKLLLAVFFLITVTSIHAFSVPSNNNDSTPSLVFDRWRVSCPADTACIQQYDSSLNVSEENNNEVVWAAVYRSNNNLPTVLLKDDFFNSMRIATTPSSSDSKSQDLIENTPLQQETPVAIARLHPSNEYPNKYVLDTLRCWLKKETLDDSCDGGSEHTEALCVGIDALLLHHLNTKTKQDDYIPIFEKSIRAKATLVSGTLLEQRGFQEISSLCKDMATHESSLEECMAKFADKTVNAPMQSSSQTVALQILSKLGELDRSAETRAAERQEKESDKEQDGDDEFDPWAGMKQYL